MAANYGFELEAELESMLGALGESFISKRKKAKRSSCPNLARVTISRFPRYAEKIGSLPKSEQQKVRQLAQIIKRSSRPGCKPVLQVDLAGHTDRDYQRGPAFEQRISTRRALELQRVLQQQIGAKISSRISWQARGVGASKLIVADPKNESDRARNRRVEVILATRITAGYPTLTKRSGQGYGWTVTGASPAHAAREGEYQLLTFPTPTPVTDSTRAPNKWICSLLVDFGPEVLPGPIVTGRRITARATGTLISRRHVLTAGHVILTQGPPKKDIFGNAVGSTIDALSIDIIPGRDGGKVLAVEPAGRRQAAKMRVSPAWRQSNATNRGFDYGLITLDQPVPADYGFWTSSQTQIVPLGDSALKDKVGRCSGYPGNFCPPPNPVVSLRCDDTNRGSTQYQMTGKITKVAAEVIETEMQIAGGHSGSPTWLSSAGGLLNLVAIASASRHDTPDVAVRIRIALLDNLRSWMREDGVTPAF